MRGNDAYCIGPAPVFNGCAYLDIRNALQVYSPFSLESARYKPPVVKSDAIGALAFS